MDATKWGKWYFRLDFPLWMSIMAEKVMIRGSGETEVRPTKYCRQLETKPPIAGERDADSHHNTSLNSSDTRLDHHVQAVAGRPSESIEDLTIPAVHVDEESESLCLTSTIRPTTATCHETTPLEITGRPASVEISIELLARQRTPDESQPRDYVLDKGSISPCDTI